MLSAALEEVLRPSSPLEKSTQGGNVFMNYGCMRVYPLSCWII
uniref:Uncharacterized protein n=1 Tax=Anguilla anguilla TaxID=7936 RepID=A0A0E9STZ9_ANGAN